MLIMFQDAITLEFFWLNTNKVVTMKEKIFSNRGHYVGSELTLEGGKKIEVRLSPATVAVRINEAMGVTPAACIPGG